jgi:hypothetical protein
MMPSTVVDAPTGQTVRLRITRTDSWPHSRGTIDMDGFLIGHVEFASADAADAFQAFLARLARRP